MLCDRRVTLGIAGLVLLGNGVLAAPLDSLRFGDEASEQAHRLTAERSERLTGSHGQPSRRLLPLNPPTWQGGRVAFSLRVEPEQANYLTIRLSGDEVSTNRLFLFCEGRQVGYRHLGDVEQLDYGAEEPAYPGRFTYHTTPLPPALTKGRHEVRFEIRANGPIWPYGTRFEQYQRPMQEPTRGLYRVYTHSEPYLAPPEDDPPGREPSVAVRTAPDSSVIDQLKGRVSQQIQAFLTATRPLDQMQMQFLARAWQVRWTPAAANPKVLAQVLAGLDHVYRRYRQKPELAHSEPSTWNPDWFGLGPCGDVLQRLAADLAAALDQTVDDGQGGRPTRRAAYAAMLVASRDWHRQHRRQYTNQSMIIDLYVYLANRGLLALGSDQALPEPQTRRYLYESCGLEPWLGSDGPAGPTRPLGNDYWQLTSQGLTKELGYVGYYGEVLDWVNQIYEATRASPGAAGDERLRAQLVRMAHARAPFRYPAQDAAGYRAMRAETVVGWRDHHYPGDVTYGQRPSWDGSPLQTAAATLDPDCLGHVQQMMADGQLFASLAHQMTERSFRATMGLLDTPDQLARVMAQPAQPARLPMTPGQPDYLFADVDDGVLALKHGDTVLYASLYWRARHGLNNLARVHLLTPTTSHLAVAREATQFDDSGLTYTRRDWTDWGFHHGGFRYPIVEHSAHEGEVLPIARVPAGVEFKPGDESVYAGRACWYWLRYGRYLIGMNTTRDRTYLLDVPADRDARRLPARTVVPAGRPLRVEPRSTVVLDLGG